MKNRPNDSGVAGGIVILVLCHICYGVTTAILLSVRSIQKSIYQIVWPNSSLPIDSGGYAEFTFWDWSILALCIAQGLYALPLYHSFRDKRQYEIAKGILICAVTTAFLTGPRFLLGIGQ